jgi:transketolase
MRKIIADSLLKQMRHNKDIFLLFGDVGFGVLDDIREEFPTRAINCGIAEQNMIGVAAGLSLAGKIPVVYSIAPFVSARVYEQIKLDLCQQKLKVMILGAGSGFSYGSLGPTHHCLEDFSSLTTLPNMTLFSPVDNMSADWWFLDELQNGKGPSYFRLTSENNSTVPLGRTRGDTKILAMAHGGIYQEMREVIIENHFDMDFKAVEKFANTSFENYEKFLDEWDRFVIVEEAYKRGGFGSLVLELLNGMGLRKNVLIIAADSVFASTGGDRKYQLKVAGLDKDSIARKIKDWL